MKNMANTKLTSNGLKNDLTNKGYKPHSSIAEYIWNGFDARASSIKVTGQYVEHLGGLQSFSITDNGTGISDPESFKPIFESKKKKDYKAPRFSSDQRGKNGLGRLTFFTFANESTWQTVYENNDGLNYKYEISINANSLTNWKHTEEIVTDEPPGTTVSFTNLRPNFTDITKEEIISYLKLEFGWYLELHKSKNYSININGASLDYSDKIMQSKGPESYSIDEYDFETRFVLWTNKTNNEYSRYYFLDSEGNETLTDTTTLNNKGDSFFHSIYIKSSFFNKIPDPRLYQNNTQDSQVGIFKTAEAKTSKSLYKYMDQYLHDKRRPFITEAAGKLVDEYEKKGIFPEYDYNNDWERYKKDSLYTLIQELYQVEPKIFKSLNVEQKKIFIRFLELILQGGEKDKLFDILKQVVSLDSVDLEQLAKTLRTSRLSNIVKTIKLIEDRCKAISQLEMLVLEIEKFNANEPDHLQKLIENHYWIFGEKYHLVTAEEPDFEQALRGHIALLRAKDVEDIQNQEEEVTIDHPDKRKQMDIFMCRQNEHDSSINHVVVELKNPKLRLGRNQIEQVKKYMEVILNEPRFNASNSSWDFYLVGNRFSKSGAIEREIKNSKHHGEASLVYNVDNCKIYVKKWSDIINDFKIRHKFLQDKLQTERHKLIEEEKFETANEIIKNSAELSSSLPGPIVKSKKQAAPNKRKK